MQKTIEYKDIKLEKLREFWK